MVGEPFLNINCDHLRSFDTNLYRQLICYPQERVEMLKELSRKPDIYERLSLALAPSIYEHEDIKKL
ncbi:unnamed protein product [Eretmochelys imbricata]